MEKNTDNRLVIIVKIEKYIEYMLTILLKLPRTEKFSIGTEVKKSMYEMLKNILLITKIEFISFTIFRFCRISSTSATSNDNESLDK